MDAFAVSICKGLGMRKVNKKQALVIGLFFGGFQALMPFVGWLLGSQFEKYITSIDHWIAFLENNLNEDGSVNVPKALQPYMGGKEKLVPLK